MKQLVKETASVEDASEADITVDSHGGTGRNGDGKIAEFKKNGSKLGAKLPKKIAESIGKSTPTPLEKDLNRTIEQILHEKVSRKEMYVELRRKKAGDELLAWLGEHGRLLRSEDEQLYYFYRPEKRLYDIETIAFFAFLYRVTGCNPAGTDFNYLKTDVQSAAIQAARQKIVKVSYWDNVKKVLYVSRFDGTVYCLDGESISEAQNEENGNHLHFKDESDWEPYDPVDGDNHILNELCYETPSWDGNNEIYGLGLKAWLLGTFFVELCPTRPILVLYGEKGSGKSMTFRMILKLIFGSNAELLGVPDKPDGFTASASANHIMIIDNLDDLSKWMRDKLARLCTGAQDEYRKLYTNNERGKVHYRSWLAVTSRNPETLRRDDLADRLIVLPMIRIKDGEQAAERSFLSWVDQNRNKFWGAVLRSLNQVVAEIRKGNISEESLLRMADWETIGRCIAQMESKEEIWDQFIEKIKGSQSELLLENESICDAIDEYLKDDSNYNCKLAGAQLYAELTTALFKEQEPTNWYRNHFSFCAKLKALRSNLSEVYGLQSEKGTSRQYHNRLLYWFEKEK